MTTTHKRRAAVALTAMAALAPTMAVSSASAAPKTISGTFKVAPGKYEGGKATGSYFRMGFGSGNLTFLENGNSTATNKTYTLLKPGTKGITSGKYQSPAGAGFDSSGNSLAGAIIQPSLFFGKKFGVFTAAGTPTAPAPSFTVNGTTLTANLSSFTVGWNNLTFNQGSPKPGGASPRATGKYSSVTRKWSLDWKSTIVGGPFNGFTGVWHLEGTFSKGWG